MVIFVERIAFIHVQPSSSEGSPSPEIHAHFSAGLTTPKGSRSMRVVITEENSRDFIDQLENFSIDCTFIRQRMAELKKSA
jgi:hypothetical protein